MKIKRNKRGISLIVMVISIIVMIILATAVILALSSNGIIGKANKAKTDSDAATLKEYINVLKSEWEVLPETQKAEKSIDKYVNEKLKEKGYTSAYMTSDETVYTNLQENAKVALENGLKIGDVVYGYELDSSKTSYTTSGKENTGNLEGGKYKEVGDQSQIITRTEYRNWKYIGIGNDGELLIAPDMDESLKVIQMSGKGRYLNGPQELNEMCNAMYSSSKGTARSMNIDDITRILDYTGPKGSYYDAEGNEVTTMVPKKISEIATLKYTQTPDGSAIGDYYSDYYNISKTSTYILKSLNTENSEDTARMKTLMNFVYCGSGYWLATSCVRVRLIANLADFGTLCVTRDSIDIVAPFFSTGYSKKIFSLAFRPVVSINSDVPVGCVAGRLYLY